MPDDPAPASHCRPAPLAPRGRRARHGEGRQTTRQLSVRVPEDLLAEIDAAIDATAPHGGPTDKTALVTTAVHAALQTLRDQHNHGQPFPTPTPTTPPARPPTSP